VSLIGTFLSMLNDDIQTSRPICIRMKCRDLEIEGKKEEEKKGEDGKDKNNKG
jgi:hypothetical protein